MKSFKTFVSEIKDKDWKKSPLCFISSNMEAKDKYDLKESLGEKPRKSGSGEKPRKSGSVEKKKTSKTNKKQNSIMSLQSWIEARGNQPYRRSMSIHGAEYNGYIHDNPDFAPLHHTNADTETIGHYTGTSAGDIIDGTSSSRRINGHLRYLADPNAPGAKKDQDHLNVVKAAKRLLSTFNNNMNQKKFESFSGIPPSLGENLAKMRKGSKHHIAGFTSASTDFKTVPFDFAHEHADNEGRYQGPYHIVHWEHEPNSAMSVAKLSKAHKEDEVIIPAGNKVTKLGTETYYYYEEGDKNPVVYHIHRFKVHNERKPIDEYDGMK